MKNFFLIAMFVLLMASPLMAAGMIQDGLCKVYSGEEDGFLLMIEMQRQSLRDGAAIQFYENGLIDKIGWYRQGILDGVFQSFWNDGQLKSLLDYKDGLLDGRVYHYDRQGQPQFLLSFEKGMLQGQGLYYEDGRLNRTVTYHHDRALAINYH